MYRNEEVPSWKHKNVGFYLLLALWTSSENHKGSAVAIDSSFNQDKEIGEQKLEGQERIVRKGQSWTSRKWVGGIQQYSDESMRNMRKDRCMQVFGFG